MHYWQVSALHRRKLNVDVLLAALREMLEGALYVSGCALRCCVLGAYRFADQFPGRDLKRGDAKPIERC